jgi:hypothetical protein
MEPAMRWFYFLSWYAVAAVAAGCAPSSAPPGPSVDAAVRAARLSVRTVPAPHRRPYHRPVRRPDTRSQAELTRLACTAPGGKWNCASSQVPAPRASSGGLDCPACTIQNWYGDEQNTTGCASDSNSCTSATCGGTGVGPCLHLFQQLIVRYGTTAPILPGDTGPTYNLLSDEAADDPYTLAPYSTNASSTTTPSVLGSLAVTYLTGTVASRTLTNRCTNGTAPCGSFALPTITVTGVDWSTACSGTCVGAYVSDTTAGTQFFIHADDGAGVAAITTSISLTTGLAVPVSPGDSITVGRPTLFYGPSVVSQTVASQVSVAEVTFESPVVRLDGLSAAVSDSVVSSTTTVAATLVGPLNPQMTSVYFDTFAQLGGSATVFGGEFVQASVPALTDQSSLDGDVYVATTGFYTTLSGTIFVGDVYWTGTTNFYPGMMLIVGAVNDAGLMPALWGPGDLDPSSGFVVDVSTFASRTFENAVLVTGPLGINGSGTGCTFGDVAGVYSCDAGITQAAVDHAPNQSIFGTNLNGSALRVE